MSFQSRSEAGASLFRYLGIKSNISVAWDGLQTSLSGGYAVSVPPVSPNRITDRLQIYSAVSGTGFSHSSGAFVSLPPVLAASLTIEDRLEAENLLQEWEGSVTAPIGLPFKTDLFLALSQASNAEDLPTDTLKNIFSDAYAFMAPWDGDLYPERRGIGKFTAGLETQNLSLYLSPSLTFAVTGADAQRLEQSGAFLFRIPARFGQNPLTEINFELSYLLGFTSIDAAFASTDFVGDFNGVFDSMSAQRYLLTGPIYDLFADTLFSAFETQTQSYSDASYNPSLSLSFSKKYGSYLTDLFVPSDISAGFERSLRRKSDAVSQDYKLTAQSRATALNLFGRFGAYQLLDLYDTDEFSTSIGLDMGFSASWQIESVNPLIQHYVLFFGKNGSELSLENRFELVHKDETTWSEVFSGSFTCRDRQ